MYGLCWSAVFWCSGFYVLWNGGEIWRETWASASYPHVKRVARLVNYYIAAMKIWLGLTISGFALADIIRPGVFQYFYSHLSGSVILFLMGFLIFTAGAVFFTEAWLDKEARGLNRAANIMMMIKGGVYAFLGLLLLLFWLWVGR